MLEILKLYHNKMLQVFVGALCAHVLTGALCAHVLTG